MDSLITAAARSLAKGDPIGALNRVALRDDAPALALRGIAMAQLDELGRAKELLNSLPCRLPVFGIWICLIPCMIQLLKGNIGGRDRTRRVQ